MKFLLHIEHFKFWIPSDITGLRHFDVFFSKSIKDLKTMISAVFAKCKIMSINARDQGVRICTKCC